MGMTKYVTKTWVISLQKPEMRKLYQLMLNAVNGDEMEKEDQDFARSFLGLFEMEDDKELN